jgi:hypothetical protein
MASSRLSRILTVTLVLLFFSGVWAGAEDGISGLEVAKRARGFVSSLSDGNGSYYYALRCDKTGSCRPSDRFVIQNYAWVSLADSALYEATGDKSYLRDASAEMDKFLGECEGTENFDCMYSSVQAYELYNLTGESRYLRYMNFNGTVPEQYTYSTMVGPVLSREMAIAYRLGLQTNLTGLMASMGRQSQAVQQEKSWLNTSGGDEFRMNACWAQLAQIELYRTMKGMPDDKVLDYGKSIGLPSTIKTHGVSRELSADDVRAMMLADTLGFFRRFNFTELIQTKKMFIVPLVNTEPCIDALLNLDDLGKDNLKLSKMSKTYGFKESAVALLQDMVDSRWDSSGRPMFNGDDGFLMQGCRHEGDGYTCYDNLKPINDNAYAVYLFSRVPEHRFIIGKNAIVTRFNTGGDDPRYNEYFGVTTTQAPTTKTTATTLAAGGSMATQKITYALLLLTIAVIAAFIAWPKSKKKPEDGDVGGL